MTKLDQSERPSHLRLLGSSPGDRKVSRSDWCAKLEGLNFLSDIVHVFIKCSMDQRRT